MTQNPLPSHLKTVEIPWFTLRILERLACRIEAKDAEDIQAIADAQKILEAHRDAVHQFVDTN